MSDDLFEMVERKADSTQFNEYLNYRRKSLKQQAEALEQQRRAIMIEIGWIEKKTGLQIIRKEQQ